MPTIDVKQTGENIRKICRDKGMTLKDIADVCCISTAAVSKWGRTCMPSIDAIVVLSHIWNVRMEDIVAVIHV